MKILASSHFLTCIPSNICHSVRKHSHSAMLRSLLCTALALCFAPSLWSAQVWAPGVSEEEGWYDYNKAGINDGYTADTGMCWAYSASNVIAWWQEQNADSLTSSGVTVPQNEQIVKTFVGVFSNIGGVPSDGYSWYINGGVDNKLNATETVKGEDGQYKTEYTYKDNKILDLKDTSAIEMQLGLTGFNIKDLANGGILKDVYTDGITIIFGAHYINNPYDFGEKIIQTLSDGYALSLSVREGHAYTLWGVEYENTDNGLMITKAWITDSDDINNTGSGLLEKSVGYSDKIDGFSTGIYFSEHQGLNWENLAGIRTSQVILEPDMPMVPEPSTATLSLLALAGLALRRRRK